MPHAYWFGEDQARYIVTMPVEQAGLVLAKMKGAGVPCARIGTTGGDAIAIAGQKRGAGQGAGSRLRELVSGLYGRQGVLNERRPHGRSENSTSIVRLIAEAIKMAGNPIEVSFHAGLGHTSRKNQCSFDANCYSTCVAPGILRKAAVAAQLKASVRIKTTTALRMALTCITGASEKSCSAYCSHSTGI